VAGLIAHGEATTLFYCPYVNSYKRFLPGSFAPTALVWSVDNRSAALRVCSPQSRGIRIEQRIGGADLNPYVAMAAMISAGLAGVEQGLALPDAVVGNAYRRDCRKSRAAWGTPSRQPMAVLGCARRGDLRWSTTGCKRRAGSWRKANRPSPTGKFNAVLNAADAHTPC